MSGSSYGSEAYLHCCFFIVFVKYEANIEQKSALPTSIPAHMNTSGLKREYSNASKATNGNRNDKAYRSEESM